LPSEVLEALRPVSDGAYVDCTLGAGGHAESVLEASSPAGWLLGIDADPGALALASERLRRFGERVALERANYQDLDVVLARKQRPQVN
jgi:16S rRNA (cytosine1402-N4)-methyltransferase